MLKNYAKNKVPVNYLKGITGNNHIKIYRRKKKKEENSLEEGGGALIIYTSKTVASLNAKYIKEKK